MSTWSEMASERTTQLSPAAARSSRKELAAKPTPIAFSLTTREASVGNRGCSPSATRRSTTAAANSTTIRRILQELAERQPAPAQIRPRAQTVFSLRPGRSHEGNGHSPLYDARWESDGLLRVRYLRRSERSSCGINIHLTLRSPPARFLRLRGGSPTCLGVTSWQRTGYGTRWWEGRTLVP